MLKLMAFERRGNNGVTMHVEGEPADLDELLKRVMNGEALKSLAPAPVLTLTPPPAAPAPAKAPKAPAPAVVPAAAPAPAPPAKPAKAAPAPDPDDDDDDDGAPAAPTAIPQEIMEAQKVRQVLDALVVMLPKQGKVATVESLTEWCLANAQAVPVLKRLAEAGTLAERVQNASRLIGLQS